MPYSEEEEMVDSDSESSFNTNQIKYCTHFFFCILINVITKRISLSFSLSHCSKNEVFHEGYNTPFGYWAYQNSWTVDASVGRWTLDAGRWMLHFERWALGTRHYR